MEKIIVNLNELKDVALQQNRALLAEDMELYFNLNNKKKSISDSVNILIAGIIKNNFGAAGIKNESRILLEEILAIEKSNNNIMKSQLKDLSSEKTKINLNKKLNKTYYWSLMNAGKSGSASKNLNGLL